MAKKQLKETGAKLTQQLRTRAVGNFLGRLNFLGSTIYARLAMIVPAQFRWIVPFLESELELRPPTFNEMVQKLKGEEIEAELTPEIKEAIILEERKTCLYVPVKYRKYNCLLHNPFNCKWTEKTVLEDHKNLYCLKCNFPAILAPEWKIRGDYGKYQVKSFIGHRNEGRVYQGEQIPDGKPVIIKEYLLPKLEKDGYFNEEEIAQRKNLFTRLAGLKLADGRDLQDFRLITPFEAIADAREERCYIIIKPKTDLDPNFSALYQSPTLASYLDQTGALSNYEVWRFLNQVLQSLEFLHTQKFKQPDNSTIMGIPHGNITLESLLITFTFQGFFIYLSDLALWENRFDLPDATVTKPSVEQDLKDLGKVAFYLLAGSQVNRENCQLLNPHDQQNWGENVDADLRQFILNLMGLGVQFYPNATIARQVLLKLPLAETIIPDVTFSEIEVEKPKEKKKFNRLWLWLISILGVFFLAFLIWFFGFRNRQNVTIPTTNLPCCIKEIAGVPEGIFTFTAEKNGIWSYIYNQKDLIVKNKTLEQEILEKQPELKLAYLPENSATVMLEKIKNREFNFAITSQLQNLEDEYESRIFAHDGLVIYIPFSYATRDQSLPKALHGKISLKQIRDLYTGKFNNWQQLGGPDLPIKLYLPPNDEAIMLFEQKILKEDEYIKDFRDLIARNNSNITTDKLPEIIRAESSFQNLKTMIENFEKEANDRSGGVGFDSLSKVFGQCSVYPLAIVEDNFHQVSPLLQANNQKPISADTDLCKKGSYIPNIKAFITQQYPFAYPLGIVYLKDNRQEAIGEKFAEILTTKEAQEMLFKTGLVPIQP